MASNAKGIRYLAEKDVLETNLSMKEVIAIVEEVYRRHGTGRVLMPPKRGVNISELESGWRTGATAMFGYEGGTRLVGLKWNGENKGNIAERSLPNCIATALLNDGESFMPKAIIQGLWITGMRTGAETAVGVKYLARSDMLKGGGTIAIIGCGAQARFQLQALGEVCKPSRMLFYDTVEESLKRFHKYATEQRILSGVKLETAKSAEDAVGQADVVVTVTSTGGSPIVQARLLRPGALVCAIGSQQELSLDAIKLARRVVVDNIEQILHSGQLIRWISGGWLREREITDEIGDIVAGKKPGRQNDEDVIVYMPGGMATLDIAVGSRVMEIANERNLGTELPY